MNKILHYFNDVLVSLDIAPLIKPEIKARKRRILKNSNKITIEQDK